MLVLYNMVMGI